MSGPSFKPFDDADDRSLNILTLAARYPSQVQPWMINHLYQLENNGAASRIISVNTDATAFSESLKDYDLSKYYWHLGGDNRTLLARASKQLIKPSVLLHTLKLLSKTSWPASSKQKIIQAISAYAMTLRPDLIHCHSEPAGSRLYHLIKANGAPLVHTFHGQTPEGVPTISREDRARYTRYARAIFVNTRFAQKRYEALGAENDNFIVIPQGTDISKWDFTPSPCPSGDDVLNVLTVGRLVEEKGHRYVIDAIAQLRRNNINAHYHIVGPGPQAQKLQQQIDSQGLQDVITIHGLLTGEALAEQYKKAHIFVLPSLKGDGESSEETQGVVVQEAQACGLLVIAADSGGIGECIKDGENAFLVPDKDANAIANTINALLSAPDKWLQWQNNARDWVSTHYSLESTGRRLFDVYEQVAPGKL